MSKLIWFDLKVCVNDSLFWKFLTIPNYHNFWHFIWTPWQHCTIKNAKLLFWHHLFSFVPIRWHPLTSKFSKKHLWLISELKMEQMVTIRWANKITTFLKLRSQVLGWVSSWCKILHDSLIVYCAEGEGQQQGHRGHLLILKGPP